MESELVASDFVEQFRIWLSMDFCEVWKLKESIMVVVDTTVNSHVDF